MARSTINNTFTNDSKLKHKEGGIFDIVVSTGEQKKKKSKPKKEENDLLPQSELKPKKKTRRRFENCRSQTPCK